MFCYDLEGKKIWERNLGMSCRLYALRNKERISVAAASNAAAAFAAALPGSVSLAGGVCP